MEWHEATCFLNGQWRPLARRPYRSLTVASSLATGLLTVIRSIRWTVSARRSARVNTLHAAAQLRRHRARQSVRRSQVAATCSTPIIERHPWPRQFVALTCRSTTDGVAKRDHAFRPASADGVHQTLAWAAIAAQHRSRRRGRVTHADERWLHCDIKSNLVLGNVLMKQYATDHDAFETVMLRDGFLTEG